MTSATGALLRVESIGVCYDGVVALEKTSFVVRAHELVAIIGPNGAGKSTALKAVCGLVRVSAGNVFFRGREITGRPLHKLVRLGIGLAPEERHVFPTMTVRENLEMGGYSLRSGALVRQRLAYVRELLPLLAERWRQKARTLSGGEQQLLSMGRALMIEPELLLLDEPSFALSPNYIETVFGALAAIHSQGRSILLVEQNARRALEAADRAYVFRVGGVALEGPARDLLGNPQVRAAFLGEDTPPANL